MRFRSGVGRTFLVPAFGLALAASIAACSSSSSSPSSSSSTPASSPTAAASSGGSSVTPASGSATAAIATIKANWTKFFAGSTPTSQRVTLLQNGQKFSSAMAGLSAMGSSASVKVASVTIKTPTSAAVKYSIFLGSTPALPNVVGTSVYENGNWLVADTSLCQLLTMQNAGKAPAVCSSAS